jgi:hypothetical protein
MVFAVERTEHEVAGLTAHAAESITVPVEQPGPSTEIGRRLEAMLNPAVRLAFTRVPIVATNTAARQGAIHLAEAPVWVGERTELQPTPAALDLTAVAGVTNY